MDSQKSDLFSFSIFQLKFSVQVKNDKYIYFNGDISTEICSM